MLRLLTNPRMVPFTLVRHFQHTTAEAMPELLHLLKAGAYRVMPIVRARP